MFERARKYKIQEIDREELIRILKYYDSECLSAIDISKVEKRAEICNQKN